MKSNSIAVFCCDKEVDLFFEVVDYFDEELDRVTGKTGRLWVENKAFEFPLGVSSTSTKLTPTNVFKIETVPLYGGGFTSVLCFFDYRIPVSELVKSSQAELDEKYFYQHFEKRYKHRKEENKRQTKRATGKKEKVSERRDAGKKSKKCAKC